MVDCIFIRSLILAFAILSGSNILHAQSDEFHYGFGGISIRTGGEPHHVRGAVSSIDSYTLTGYWFDWENGDHQIRLLVASIFGGRTWIAKPDVEVVPKWKAEFVRQLTPKTTVKESAYTFQNSKGFELRTSGERHALTRIFSIRSHLIAASIYVDKPEDVDSYRRILDSIRTLTHVERTVAMIEESTPPSISQDRPKEFQIADTTELGLVGAVRMVRDIAPADGKVESRIVHEIHFDNDGFKTREILFNQNYPDVITAWGWHEGKRVNIQSAVNYPPGEGPLGGRTTIITGSISIPGFGTVFGIERKYGNRIETEFDSSNRPLVRRRFLNTGSLTLVEHFKYFGSEREIRTVDSSGGFMGAIREKLDAKNNVTETKTLSSDGKVFESTRFEYEFDSKGNWKIKKAFRKGTGGRITSKPASVVQREIRYHEQQDQRRIG